MNNRSAVAALGWLGIVRLGLVQASLGAIVVVTTSTLNRVMVVELALPAVLPGLLVAWHYVVQLLRPRFGHGSDQGGRRTPWIIGGMVVLAAGAVIAALACSWLATDVLGGVLLAALGFTLIGVGVGASGTSLLVLLAKRVDPRRRAAAATITWLMMIFGFILTTALVGKFLEPFTFGRLLSVTACVGAVACVVTLLAVWGVEGRNGEATAEPAAAAPQPTSFRTALRQVWGESQARRMATFIFVSMIAYSAQDLILEPFAGTVFGMTPAESTRLSSLQNVGVLIGMVMVAISGTVLSNTWVGSMRLWRIGGCAASAAALLALVMASIVGPEWPLKPTVVALGIANGAFAVAAIGSMMGLVGAGRQAREGVRMGLWGAAQAIAFALGGFLGTLGVDVARALLGSPTVAYAAVFAAEAVLFVVAAKLAADVVESLSARTSEPVSAGDGFVTHAGART